MILAKKTGQETNQEARSKSANKDAKKKDDKDSSDSEAKKTKAKAETSPAKEAGSAAGKPEKSPDDYMNLAPDFSHSVLEMCLFPLDACLFGAAKGKTLIVPNLERCQANASQTYCTV